MSRIHLILSNTLPSEWFTDEINTTRALWLTLLAPSLRLQSIHANDRSGLPQLEHRQPATGAIRVRADQGVL